MTAQGITTDKAEEDLRAAGVAGYAMMLAVLMAMLRTGREDEALALVGGAKMWLSEEKSARSPTTMMARQRILHLENNLNLLAIEPRGRA
jgi:hypothetical protein